MQHRLIAFASFVGAASGTAFIAGASSALRAPRWKPQAAAAYLDQRQAYWESWPKAARDHGTVCLSCHTALPYALARPELGAELQETQVPAAELKLMADVVTRVRAWDVVKPFYGDTTPKGRAKAEQSRGTESVLNALVLASRDHRDGVVSADARRAFANMFALQQTNGDDPGAWAWLDFDLRPWESASAKYFGAALAAIAVGLEPQAYAETPAIQPNLTLLRHYLRGHVEKNYWNRLRRRDDPTLFNNTMLLWASSRLSGLLTSEERRSIVAALWDAQEPDGSWKLSRLGYWRPHDGAAQELTGDGYATGLITYALEESGTAPNDAHLAHALSWLASHQDPGAGMWSASSLNKHRDPTTNVGRFMSDAATAYAVLALTRADQVARVADVPPDARHHAR